MAFDPLHGYEALRRGRWSTPGAEYFLTFCTADRKPGLATPSLRQAIQAELLCLEQDGLWLLRSATVMPDHVHLLVVLSDAATLSDITRRCKGRLTPALRAAGLRWQPAYFDHRMRPAEDRLPVFLYIFLNPYRANLINPGETWPGFYCSPQDWTWFENLTNQARPVPEWLD